MIKLILFSIYYCYIMEEINQSLLKENDIIYYNGNFELALKFLKKR